MIQRNELSDEEIAKTVELVKEKIGIRFIEKHRGAYVGNHETYGILAEEFYELLKALRADDNEEFFCELIDIIVGGILGMASMYANKRAATKKGEAPALQGPETKAVNDANI